MLSEEDINSEKKEDKQSEALEFPIAKIWGDLEPETDSWDLRLLYEVTGVRLDESEQRRDDTSDEEEGEEKKGWNNLFINNG